MASTRQPPDIYFQSSLLPFRYVSMPRKSLRANHRARVSKTRSERDSPGYLSKRNATQTTVSSMPSKRPMKDNSYTQTRPTAEKSCTDDGFISGGDSLGIDVQEGRESIPESLRRIEHIVQDRTSGRAKRRSVVAVTTTEELEPWTLCPPEEAKTRMPPDVAKQYETAGLAYHEPLPRGRFPHAPFELRALKARKNVTIPNSDLNAKLRELRPPPKGLHLEGETSQTTTSMQSLRQQSLMSLTSIMRRMVEERDHTRAARAFGLLLRSRLHGQGLDLLDPKVWGSGAEILLRSGNLPAPPVLMRKPIDTTKNRISRSKQDGKWSSRMKFFEDSDAEEEARQQSALNLDATTRYEEELRKHPLTTESAWQQARLFFESLIMRYQPTSRRMAGRVDSFELYQQMYSHWILHIEELRRTAETDAHDQSTGCTSNANKAGNNGDELMYTLAEIVSATHERVVALAEHMDEVVTVLPFSDDHRLVLLRAKVERWLAELCIPLHARLEFSFDSFPDDDDDDDDYDEDIVWRRDNGSEHVDGLTQTHSDSDGDERHENPTEPQETLVTSRKILRMLSDVKMRRAQHRKEARRLMLRSVYLAKTQHLRVNAADSYDVA